MRLIIAGTRHADVQKLLWPISYTLYELDWYPDEIVCGMARGADTAGRIWAENHGIPWIPFAPNWGEYGKAAGPIRNRLMAEYGTHLLAFMAPNSRGTASMVREMQRVGKPLHIVPYPLP